MMSISVQLFLFMWMHIFICDVHYLTDLNFFHSVLVHSGGVHGGHYYAFIRPTLSEQWYVYSAFRSEFFSAIWATCFCACVMMTTRGLITCFLACEKTWIISYMQCCQNWDLTQDRKLKDQNMDHKIIPKCPKLYIKDTCDKYAQIRKISCKW